MSNAFSSKEDVEDIKRILANPFSSYSQKYKFYIKSPHWRKLRLKKIKSVNRICHKCGIKDPLAHVHHLRYKNLIDVELEDLQVLCKNCHEKHHGSKFVDV